MDLVANIQLQEQLELDIDRETRGAILFKCISCNKIPVSPIKECLECEEIYCNICNQTKNDENCKGCNKKLELRKINRGLMNVL